MNAKVIQKPPLMSWGEAIFLMMILLGVIAVLTGMVTTGDK